MLGTWLLTPRMHFMLAFAHEKVGDSRSAELEAGIAGRPVFTLLSRHEGADGQSNTLHFDYLLRERSAIASTCRRPSSPPRS